MVSWTSWSCLYYNMSTNTDDPKSFSSWSSAKLYPYIFCLFIMLEINWNLEDQVQILIHGTCWVCWLVAPRTVVTLTLRLSQRAEQDLCPTHVLSLMYRNTTPSAASLTLEEGEKPELPTCKWMSPHIATIRLCLIITFYRIFSQGTCYKIETFYVSVPQPCPPANKVCCPGYLDLPQGCVSKWGIDILLF